MHNNSITLALTGASGIQYGLRLLECLLQADQQVNLLISKPAKVVIATETELKLPSSPADISHFFSQRYHAQAAQLQVFSDSQWTAPIASGSNAPKAMVVCPCTSATLSAIAIGASRSLLERAADVVIKERRPLILVHREMPISAIHLEHMLKLAQYGATIMPASPGFYHQPQTIADIIDFVVARILDHLDIKHNLVERWGETSPK